MAAPTAAAVAATMMIVHLEARPVASVPRPVEMPWGASAGRLGGGGTLVSWCCGPLRSTIRSTVWPSLAEKDGAVSAASALLTTAATSALGAVIVVTTRTEAAFTLSAIASAEMGGVGDSALERSELTMVSRPAV